MKVPISVIPLPFKAAMNPYPDALPDSVSKIWNARMKAFFDLFVKHADVWTV